MTSSGTVGGDWASSKGWALTQEDDVHQSLGHGIQTRLCQAKADSQLRKEPDRYGTATGQQRGKGRPGAPAQRAVSAASAWGAAYQQEVGVEGHLLNQTGNKNNVNL